LGGTGVLPADWDIRLFLKGLEVTGEYSKKIMQLINFESR
jgi:hypothetical protein